MKIEERDEAWTAFDIEFKCGCKGVAAGPVSRPADFFRLWEYGEHCPFNAAGHNPAKHQHQFLEEYSR